MRKQHSCWLPCSCLSLLMIIYCIFVVCDDDSNSFVFQNVHASSSKANESVLYPPLVPEQIISLELSTTHTTIETQTTTEPFHTDDDKIHKSPHRSSPLTTSSWQEISKCDFSVLPAPLREVIVPISDAGFIQQTFSLLLFPYGTDFLSGSLWNTLQPRSTQEMMTMMSATTTTTTTTTPKMYFDQSLHFLFEQVMKEIESQVYSKQHDKFNRNNGKHNRPLVVDIGANIGLVSLYFATKGAAVYAFEPHPENYNMLKCSAERNALFGHLVHVFPYAIDTLDNRTPLITKSSDSQSKMANKKCMVLDEMFAQNKMAYVVKDAYTLSAEQKHHCVNTETVRLDDVWSSPDMLASRHIDVLKIDVEGMDYFVLKSAEEMFDHDPPSHVFIEYSPPQLRAAGLSSPSDLLDWFVSHSYSLQHIVTSTGLIVNIVDEDHRNRELSTLYLLTETWDGKSNSMAAYVDLHFVYFSQLTTTTAEVF